MELKGAINMYEVAENPPKFTINLAHGVTPFMKSFDGVTRQSAFYRLRPGITIYRVTHAWYRPGREEFDALDKPNQDHVLNGGLLFAPLGEATQKQTPHDRVCEGMATEAFRVFCADFYGRSL